jgi:hypothetical protein
VTGSFQEQSDVIYGLNQMIEDAGKTKLKVLCGLEKM